MGMAKKIFWGSVAGLVHTHVTYPLTLAAIERLRGPRPESAAGADRRAGDSHPSR